MSERLRVALLLAMAMLVYGNTLVNGFTYDDGAYILHNPAVKTLFSWRLFQPFSENNLFRPVTFATFALNNAVQGERPFGYHLVNMLLHAAVTLLLYLLVRRLLEDLPKANTIAFVSAMLFAVHPIHSEAVASIVGRSELLAAAFLLGAWLLHLDDKPIPSLLCFLLALLSKESAVSFVPLVLAGDYARGKWKPFLRYGWIAGFAALYLILFWKIEGGRFGEKSISFLDNPLASLPAQLRILNALRIAWKYVGLHVYPATFSYDYSYNAILLYATWRHGVIALLATLAVLVLWAWALLRRRSAWFLAGAIYLGGFVAASNLLIPSGTLMGERLAYLPSAGFCLLVALIWVQLETRRATLALTILSIIVVVLSMRTVVRNQDWKNNYTLFSSGVRAVPGSARAHRNLAEAYVSRGQLEEARAEFQTALRIFQNYPEAMEDFGLLESRLGHHEDARRLFERALSLTAKGSPDHYFMEVNLATELIRLGESEEALKHLNQVIDEWAGYSPAWLGRAVIRYQRGEMAGARADAEAALRLDTSNAQARRLLNSLNVLATAPSR